MLNQFNWWSRTEHSIADRKEVWPGRRRDDVVVVPVREIMRLGRINLHLWRIIAAFLLLLVRSSGLNSDGTLLLSFKYSVLSDPLSVLESWSDHDETPCSWNGVMCTVIGTPGMPDTSRVISLVLPNCQLLGSVPDDLGKVEHLRHLDLSNNFLNGTLPVSLFNASELQVLALSGNVISGKLPEFSGGLKDLEFLNLSDNALAGKVPETLTTLRNLTVLTLSNNYFSGSIPSGFDVTEVLDLSSNLFNGSLPPNFGGDNLRYLNLSYNRFSGEIPPEFAKRIPVNATVDFSFNNLTGEIPESEALLNKKPQSFSGNPYLCGKPLKNACTIPSTLSSSPYVSEPTSPPAIAAIPRTVDSITSTGSPGTTNESQQQGQSGLRPGIIAAIVVGGVAGVAVLAAIFWYVYRLKNQVGNTGNAEKKLEDGTRKERSTSPDSRGLTAWSCLRKKEGDDNETSTTDSEEDREGQASFEQQQQQRQQNQEKQLQKRGSLVTVDGETELELETLLKASAYILGATGSSIVYKAVLENGSTFAVRRIGESSAERFRDFENQVRSIAKLRHPNLVRIRGFYWGADEKLIIFDYVHNGSLANASYKKMGSSPYHLPWEVRLKIARGVARGLTYLHEKKHVHGNLKPSNILLGPDMEPRISDFGLEKLVWGDNSYKAGGSARNFGSKRSNASRDSTPELATGASPSPCASFTGYGSPYHAPESLQNLKPNPKWDVYSFGVVLLELLSGKIFSDRDLGVWNNGFVPEEKSRVVRMADMAIRAEVEGKEDALLACFRLGFSCASVVPQKRPSMKEALQVLDKIPSSSSSSYY